MVSARRKALEKLWRGNCTVKAWQEVEDPITHVTQSKEVTLYENLMCKLSHKTLTSASSTGGPAIIAEQIKLSLGNEYEIPAGCKIIVTQDKVTEQYTRSGKPGIFMDHQEIVLDLFKEYA
ncbi:hypothetical protein AMS59_12605 [Lysinibacillus sp. FJAT-14745]|uniref:hypothetical protein n=1 Tax=Lysinibacillus sp. FJAT-14745 TaxID=1704289 RepID=UPI0006ABA227|nr:hypothetical protein [Lysinibacillus sp. FJAT-14745]KOP78655.1 hypothetical protein AMS59_12605 [Lysinibacillus sp. FJAT-14745]